MPVAVTILVIDDDPMILELLPDVLKSNSYNVVTASTLADAHAIMKQAHIDLILCDVSLPDSKQTDQWSLLGAERHRDLPFVFLTGYEQPPIHARQVLIKPFSVPDLLLAIRSELHSDDQKSR